MDGLGIDLGGVQINCQSGHDGNRKGAQLVRDEVHTEGGHPGEAMVDEYVGHATITLNADLQSKTCGWVSSFSFNCAFDHIQCFIDVTLQH